ncbi:MAG: M23 family metallopeptidase [Desulfobacterales bacterium]|jgi:hypothetical protein|nr:M23 family metallopeptidase [Desulfobacterales bacterium]
MKVDSVEILPVSGFTSHLAKINQLDRIGFERFVFFPGMTCFSFESWWGKNTARKTSHEGLDICFFTNTRKEQFRLDETTRIPILYEGRIVHEMEDFLGRTLVVRHVVGGAGDMTFLSFYAHIIPDRQLRTGDVVKEGEVLGIIADAAKTNSALISHLHISLAWECMLPPVSGLTWNVLNRVARSVFIDPLTVLSGSHVILENAPDHRASIDFIKFSEA